MKMRRGCCVFILLCFAPLGSTAASCENGGTAVGEGCACPPGFNGTRCEMGDSSKACQNGGTAVGTKCYCPPGFKGALCQVPDEASACRNGAKAFGTECVCPPGYWGPACQHKEQPSSCLNGGTLLDTGCRCPVDFWGPRCECKDPETPPAPTGNVTTSTSGTSARRSPDASEVNGTMPTTAPSMERSSGNTTENITASPVNVSASAVTAWPNRTSEATTAAGKATCSGNCTSLGGTHNGTQQPLNNTLDTTTTSPVSETTHTTRVTQHPLNNTLNTTMTTPLSETTHTMEVTRRPLNNTLDTTTTSPVSETNHTINATRHPLSNTLDTTTTSPVSETTHTIGVTQHPLNNTLNTTTTSPVSDTNRTMGVTQHSPNDTFPTTTARPISEPSTTGNVSLTTLKEPTSPPNTTTVPVNSTTSLSNFCHYFLHWYLNGSSSKPVVCHNGGVANGTECLCPPGFSGSSCETVDTADQCHNGSTAVGNRCICPPGLSGPRCDTYDNETACQNGATAVGTECYCPSGYYGPRCEFYNVSTTTVPATQPSTTRPKSTPKAPVATVQSTTSTRSTPRSTTSTESTTRMTSKPTTKSTTAAKSTKTTTTLVPTTTDPCQNEGLWTATGCSCQAYLEGDYCQFSSPTIDITPEVGSFVGMTTRVTNRHFSEAMGDPSSTAYRGFADEFERTMDQIYQNVSDYHSTKILNLRNGSVVVDYKVLLHPPPEADSSYSLDRKSRELLETLTSAAQPHNCSHAAEELCFSPSSYKVTLVEKTKANYTEICRKRVPAKFRRFYQPYMIGRRVFCVTNCTLNVPGAINCNGGNCRVTQDGPRCYCQGVPWYLTSGDHCETHISKLGLGLGVGLGLGLPLLLLLILCLVLSTCLARRKTKFSKSSESSEGSGWPGSRSKSHASGIYHVNGRGSAPWRASESPSAYKPNAEVASFSTPMQPPGEAADSL